MAELSPKFELDSQVAKNCQHFLVRRVELFSQGASLPLQDRENEKEHSGTIRKLEQVKIVWKKRLPGEIHCRRLGCTALLVLWCFEASSEAKV